MHDVVLRFYVVSPGLAQHTTFQLFPPSPSQDHGRSPTAAAPGCLTCRHRNESVRPLRLEIPWRAPVGPLWRLPHFGCRAVVFFWHAGYCRATPGCKTNTARHWLPLELALFAVLAIDGLRAPRPCASAHSCRAWVLEGGLDEGLVDVHDEEEA
ncbi:hypothetical protein M433DRAFT_251378 [Acidomyces richmondensis BFW]|nr:hypothetical protein M433DRAFT_251378 [Acidomyces richmondensis BFW]